MPSLSVEAYGVPVRVDFADEALREPLLEILPPGALPSERAPAAPTFVLRRSVPESYELAIGEEPLLRDGALELALQTLDAQIRLHVAANARELIFVHAGVVVADGGAIVLPGPSFCGKTTLVLALLELGASYYSDEYAVLDPEGRVHPYPRPPAARGAPRPETRAHHESHLSGGIENRAAAVRVVAAVPYRPSGSQSWERISPGRVVAVLLANTVPARARPHQSLRTLGKAVAGATALEGERGEATVAAAQLLGELRAAATSPR